MTTAHNLVALKGMMSSLKLLRRWRRQMFLASIFVISLFSQNVLAVTIPDSVPGWYPAETCLSMMDILIDEFGCTTEGAASVLGNVCQESKYNAQANSGYYIGICQWDPYDRWPLISNWVISNGYSTDDPCAQLRAAFNNAENSRYSDTLDYMKSVTSIEDGVHRFLVYYEGAAGQQEAERVSYAYDALELYNAN